MYKSQLDLFNKGIKSLYRSVQERKIAKLSKGKLWFAKGGYSTLLNVDYTPEGKLSKNIQNSLGEGADKGKIRIITKSGPTLLSTISNTNLMGSKSKHVMLKEGDSVSWEGGALARSAPNYTIECGVCKGNDKIVHYYGESGKNIICRAKNHQTAINGKDETHPLYLHHKTCHPDSSLSYKMTQTYSSVKPRFRQICEGVMIAHSKADEILNSRSEWFQPAVVILAARSGFYDD